MVLNLLAIFLFIMSAYVAWWAVSSAAFAWLVIAGLFLVAAFGLYRRKRWSQYLWHIIAVTAVGAWLVSVLRAVQLGWPGGSVIDTIISLVPGLLLVAVCTGGSIVVVKHFRGNKSAL